MLLEYRILSCISRSPDVSTSCKTRWLRKEKPVSRACVRNALVIVLGGRQKTEEQRNGR